MLTKKNILIGAAVAVLALVLMIAFSGPAAAVTINLDQEQSLRWHMCVSLSDAIEAAEASVADPVGGAAVWKTKVSEGLCATTPQPVPLTPVDVVFEKDFAVGPSGKLRVLRATFTKPDGSVLDAYVITSEPLVADLPSA